MHQKYSVFWFRRDLRLHDNAALLHALKGSNPVVPVFIFDRAITDRLEDRDDKRVAFIHQEVAALKAALNKTGSDILVWHHHHDDAWQKIVAQFNIDTVYFNHDYEPAAIDRDKRVTDFLQARGIAVRSFKDQCIFEKDEICKEDGTPYTVFTPYSKKWLANLNNEAVAAYPSEKNLRKLFEQPVPTPMPALEELGFINSNDTFPSKNISDALLLQYEAQRSYPAINGTSVLGIHFRFGTVSIRAMAARARLLSNAWLNELIWRDFYMMILYRFPHVIHGAFRPAYDHIVWRNNEAEFNAWCSGHTGYPIVDAGMRQLNATGYMHNRVRMITASFLSKHLLIDWRWGEAYFARKLLDYDLAANNGGWQWAAGCGTDAAPYFRIFNPALQAKKFDPHNQYIKQWIPEYETAAYPPPVVDHGIARKRCLDTYKAALYR